ncbi:MAG: hypothetical protein IKD00_01650, partial [Candidatus Methanomethylophilaceae archaeon]|nr:hypothetical protein [Candidatus Methanomethylophilaceae archaeon]
MKRVTDDYFRTRLESAGALLIEGPKWCGKTTTGEELSSSTLYMQDPDKQESLMYYPQMNEILALHPFIRARNVGDSALCTGRGLPANPTVEHVPGRVHVAVHHEPAV